MERVKDADTDYFSPVSKASALMTTMMMTRFGGRDNRMDRKQFDATRRKLESSKAFKRMMNDKRTAELIRKNDTEALFTTMADIEARRQKTLDERYKRPEDKAVVAEDAKLLKNAIDGLKENAGKAAAAGSPENERRGKLYTEMMKRLEYAQSLAEKGIQLSGESTKALIDSVKAYNDGGKKNVKPGGTKQAEGFVQSMALLKHYMPAGKFNRYCEQMNIHRNALDPKDMDYVVPEAFEPQRLTGARTAKQLTMENRQQMRDSFTAEGKRTPKSREGRRLHQGAGFSRGCAGRPFSRQTGDRPRAAEGPGAPP